MLFCGYSLLPVAGRVGVPLAIDMDKGEAIVIWEGLQVSCSSSFGFSHVLWRLDKTCTTTANVSIEYPPTISANGFPKWCAVTACICAIDGAEVELEVCGVLSAIVEVACCMLICMMLG